MKMAISGIHLLESTFRHASDPFIAVQPPVEQPAEVQVELAKGEAEHDYLVIVRVRSGPQSQYDFQLSYGVIMSADPETEVAPENFIQRVMTTGATIAFPYCRELLSNLSARGRFGVTWLNPVNFTNVLTQQVSAQSTATTK